MQWFVAWSVRGAGIVNRRPFGVLLRTGRLEGGGLSNVMIVGC